MDLPRTMSIPQGHSTFQTMEKEPGSLVSSRYQRCDASLEAQAEEEKKRREASNAMVVQANSTAQAPLLPARPMVDMFCPICHAPKHVDMNSFWDRDARDRFKNVKCMSPHCKTSTYNSGKWLRRPREPEATIKAWLVQNNSSQDKARPAIMALELYRTQFHGEEIVPTTPTRPYPPRRESAAPFSTRKRACMSK